MAAVCVIAGGDRRYGRLYGSLAVAGVMLIAAIALVWLRLYTAIVLVWIASGIFTVTLFAATGLYMGFTSMYHNGFSNWLNSDDDRHSQKPPSYVRALIENSKACRRPAFALALFLAAVVSGGIIVIMVKEGALDALLRVSW